MKTHVFFGILEQLLRDNITVYTKSNKFEFNCNRKNYSATEKIYLGATPILL